MIAGKGDHFFCFLDCCLSMLVLKQNCPFFYKDRSRIGGRIIRICLIIISVLTLFADYSQAAQTKSILIIHSYHPELTWVSQCEIGIRSAFDEKPLIHNFYMDTKRVSENRFAERAEAAWQAYKSLQPNLVMIGDDNGLRLLGQRFGKETTPVVYFGINNNPRSYFIGSIPKNITGVLERLPVFPWLRYLKQILPKAKTALVLMDSSATSHAIARAVFQGQEHIKAVGLATDYQLAVDWNQWQAIVLQKKWDFILIPTFHSVKQQNGLHMAFKKVVAWTCANADVPVFSHQDYTVGKDGVTGAYVVWGKTHGAQAGNIARKILYQGLVPGKIHPVADKNGQFFFNQKNLTRFNLTLPESIKRNANFQ